VKVWITLDYLDGSSSRIVKEPVHIDEINLQGMLFRLIEKDVAGVTFTRSDVLNRLTEGDPKQ
jgi:hypothetical protein